MSTTSAILQYLRSSMSTVDMRIYVQVRLQGHAWGLLGGLSWQAVGLERGR